jgi:prevent-host-death family protein
METIPASRAREKLFNLIDRTLESHKPIAISSRRGNVVMISQEDWEAIQETLYLMSIPGMKESIIEGANTPIEECIPLEDLTLDVADSAD